MLRTALKVIGASLPEDESRFVDPAAVSGSAALIHAFGLPRLASATMTSAAFSAAI